MAIKSIYVIIENILSIGRCKAGFSKAAGAFLEVVNIHGDTRWVTVMGGWSTCIQWTEARDARCPNMSCMTVVPVACLTFDYLPGQS